MFGVKLEDYAHWINGGRLPAKLFADHKNLLALFSDKVRPLTCTRPSRDKMTRWGLNLMRMTYTIHHIDGIHNHLADLGSRWGNRFARVKAEKHKAVGLSGGASVLLTSRNSASKKALRLPMPKVQDKIIKPDLDVKEFILPSAKGLVDRDVLAAAQELHAKEKPAGLELAGSNPKLWQNKEGLVWVPDSAKRVQKMLYALAHQGLSGHRGATVTTAILSEEVYWTTMSDDVAKWRSHCLQCLKNAEGELLVPRPMGSSIVPEYPGEVVSTDYIKMGLSRSGFVYVLMHVDKLSRAVQFTPAVAATGIHASRATLTWAARYGLPRFLISDGGSHFKNTLMEELAAVLGFEHHITLAYCPWANGSVEVVGKDLLWTCRTLLSELKFSADEWDLCLALIEYSIMHRKRTVLGGRSAIEVMTGRQPDNAVRMALWTGVRLKDARRGDIDMAMVDKYCERLEKSLANLHEQVRDEGERRRRRQAMMTARAPAMRFNVGDLVVIPAEDNMANPFRHSKLMCRWQGPYEVVRPVSEVEYIVQLLGEDRMSHVHWKRMRRLAGPGLSVTNELRELALHDKQKFLVESFEDWSVNTDGEVDLLVKWRGHDETNNTWEPMEQLVADVPVLVAKYVKENKGWPDLERAHKNAVRASKKKK